jgi:Sulfotransferase family
MMKEARPRGPDFLVIGAQRAGTTWLHQVLRRHPSLWLPPVKELHYFDKLSHQHTWDDDKRWRRALMSGRHSLDPWHLKYLLGKRSDDWYVSLFLKAQQKGLIAGEVTPAYATLDREVFCRIHSMNSKIKLTFIMRDPLDRAWSAVSNARKKGLLNGSFTVDKALERTRARNFAARSAYTHTIDRLEAVFPRPQLHFCFFDDLRDRPESFATGMLSFLGVEAGEVRKLLPPVAVNSASGPEPMPLEFQREMAKAYLPIVEELCERFSGPPQKWRTRYEKLLNC